MKRGEFATAWRLSDRALLRRPPADERTPRHEQRIWDGTPLAGRRVLVRCYHGLGDTIQFLRYVPVLSRIAREVTVWIQPALLDLAASIPGIGQLVELHDGAPGTACDVDVEIMELAHVFRSTEATIPRHVPYIHVEPSRPLADGSLHVGLAWTSGSWDPRRSVPFDALSPILETQGVRFTALQATEAPAQATRFAPDRPFAPITALAREVAALDLVITVDTMTAHLAGALGVPTWLMLAADCDWRWMRDRSDSPWYPTMRLYRQEAPGDWRSVIRAVTTDVAKRSHLRSPRRHPRC